MPLDRDSWTTTRSHQLRRDASDAERRLWRTLREPEFASAKFRRQAPIGRYIVDFVSFRYKLVIEVDGGHHQDAEQSKQDTVRTEWLQSQGFKVMRFWNDEILVETESALNAIFQSIEGSSQ